MKSANPAVGSAALEVLEQRRLLSASWTHHNGVFSEGALTINGEANAPNQIRVEFDATAEKVRGVVNDNALPWVALGDITSLTINGGEAADDIELDPRLAVNTLVEARGGDDHVVTAAGNDTVYGGDGNDTIHAGAGNDSIEGNAGNDRLYGKSGDDTLRGGAGDDWSHGAGGTDLIYDVQGKDVLIGGERIDVIHTAHGDDRRVIEDQDIVRMYGQPGSVTGKPQILSFALVELKSGKVISGFETISGYVESDLSHLAGQIGVQANVDVNGDGKVDQDFNGSVVFTNSTRLNQVVEGSGMLDWGIGDETGSFTLNAQPHSKRSASGVEGHQVTLTLKITERVTPAVGQANITVTHAASTAGQALHVHGLDTKLIAGEVQEALYSWDFGDPSGKHNTMEGFNAAHIYEAAGQYTVTLTVTDIAGNVKQSTLAVSVTDAQRARIFLSNGGDDRNDGSSDGHAVRTLARAMELATDDSEIFLRRGETFRTNQKLMISQTNFRMGAYGIGSEPTVLYTGALDRTVLFYVGGGADGVTIRDIHFDSVWTGNGQEGMPYALQLGGDNISVVNCTFTNMGYAVNMNAEPRGVLLQDNAAPGDTAIRDYFAWVDGQDIVLTGNTVDNSTREHAVRISGAVRTNISGNKLSNIDRTDVDQYDTAKGALVVQQGSYAYVSNNTVNGPAGIGPLGGSNARYFASQRWDTAVFRNNHFNDAQFSIGHGSQHVMMSDNVFDFDGGTLIRIDGYSDAFGRGVFDVTLDNNTGLNQSSTGQFLRIAGEVQDIVLTDNLYVAPNFAPGSFGTAAVSVANATLGGFTRISGNVWPSGKNGSAYAEAGVNWLNDNLGREGYQSAVEWRDQSITSDETFLDVTLTGSNWAYVSSSNVTGARKA